MVLRFLVLHSSTVCSYERAMATAQAIVTKAIDQLRATITPEDARVFADTTSEALWKEAREIERELGARLSLRHMGRLEPLLKSLESYSGVIDSLCQGFSPMAWAWVCFAKNPSR